MSGSAFDCLPMTADTVGFHFIFDSENAKSHGECLLRGSIADLLSGSSYWNFWATFHMVWNDNNSRSTVFFEPTLDDSRWRHVLFYAQPCKAMHTNPST